MSDGPPSPEEIEARTARPPDITVGLRLTPQGGFLSTYLGEAQQGEDGTGDVARSVVRYLRARGEVWNDPTRPVGRENGVDAEAVGPTGKLRMQITRVPQDPRYFRDVAAAGHAERRATPEELAEALIEAIRMKAARIPPATRAEITLILDGSRYLGFDFGTTANAFHQCYVAEATEFGFDDILLLGTMRLLAMLAPPPVDDPWFAVPNVSFKPTGE